MHSKNEKAGEQSLSKIAIHKVVAALRLSVSIKATPLLLGVKGEDTEWVEVRLQNPQPSADDWVGVFFNESIYEPEPDAADEVETPYICTAPVKYANFSNTNYSNTGKTSLKFQLINQRPDFSYAFFTGGLPNGADTEWLEVCLQNPQPSEDDWAGVFSPAKLNESICDSEPDAADEGETPYICTAPIKYKYANFSNTKYPITGKTSLKFQLINQRPDFSFALFTGGLSNPKLVAVSNYVSFANLKAPLFPRLAQGKAWDIMTVTWTSGYNIGEAVPFVEWGWKGHPRVRSPAGTLTFSRGSMCGMLT